MPIPRANIHIHVPFIPILNAAAAAVAAGQARPQQLHVIDGLEVGVILRAYT